MTGEFTRQVGGDGGRVPESWIGDDVLVLLDPNAKMGLFPPQPGQELTVTLAGVSTEGALLTHQFTSPNTGDTQRIGNVFYPWNSIRRIRQVELP